LPLNILLVHTLAHLCAHVASKSFEFELKSLEDDFHQELRELQEQQEAQAVELEIGIKMQHDEATAREVKAAQDYEQLREEMRSLTYEKINGLRGFHCSVCLLSRTLPFTADRSNLLPRHYTR